MDRRRRLIVGAACAAPWWALAQVDRSGPYATVLPGRVLQFPRDFGAHPAFRVEWWYATGCLQAGTRELGFQITFFQVRQAEFDANPSAFAPRHLLLAHAAVADPAVGHLLHAQKSARAGFGLAFADTADCALRLDDWGMRRDEAGYHLTVAAADFSYALLLKPEQPALLQGRAGFSQKAPDPAHASYYYSLPQLAVSGRVELRRTAAAVRGLAWMDHEWSSAYMPPAAVGWDWTGINLHDGGALMAFRMRDAAGQAVWAAASWRGADGKIEQYGPDALRFEPQRRWTSPLSGADYPVAIKVHVGTRVLALLPLFDNQEMDAGASVGGYYWEGAVRVLEGGRETGRGYLELTGYAERLRM
ncbi:MAG: carotenoid 1,2-hydratase [Rhodocyclaceae bacterium]|nr:carotenoid 1,2-hydratase [Rhodocyclaceae bacterium]MBX3668767.1 carotenoid 1,2-hydratase [Rhodocyclaceae bacterium]